MKMIDNCGCDNGKIALAKYLFEKHNIPCEEAHIVDADHKWITIIAEVRSLDPDTGETVWDEKEYTLKYWEDRKFLFLRAVSFRFFERNQELPRDSEGNVKLPIEVEYIDQGAYWVSSFLENVCFRRIHD